MALKMGTPDDIKRMHHIRREVEKLVLQYRENTEVAIIVFALCQLARTLLRKYPQETEAELLANLVMFFRNMPADPDDHPRIIVPGRTH